MGTGVVEDRGLVLSVSRSGERGELLKVSSTTKQGRALWFVESPMCGATGSRGGRGKAGEEASLLSLGRDREDSHVCEQRQRQGLQQGIAGVFMLAATSYPIVPPLVAMWGPGVGQPPQLPPLTPSAMS